jgi:hypothetical protein
LARWRGAAYVLSHFFGKPSGRILLACGLVAAGLLLRAFPLGLANAGIRSASSHISGTTGRLDPEAVRLPDLVCTFYRDLNAGRYDKAFAAAFEASWSHDLRLDTNRYVDDNRIVSFTPRAALVTRAKAELGEKGERLSIFDVVVEKLEDLPNAGSYEAYQDVRLLGKVNSYRAIERVYLAHVSGQIFATFCAHSRWEKTLVLVKFRDDRSTRIFLNGAGNLVGIRAREWLLDRKVGEYLM